MYSDETREAKFPPAPFNEFAWLDFMRQIGLNHVVTSDMLLRFCREVAAAAKKDSTDPTTFDRVSGKKTLTAADLLKILAKRMRAISVRNFHTDLTS